LRLSAAALLFATAPSFALNTAAIVSSVASPDCLEYRVVGICYWLYCTITGCTVRTSVKVRHYVSPPLRPRCRGVQLQQYRREPVD